MKYLLDTHTLLWYLLDDKSLSATARRTVDTEEWLADKNAAFHSRRPV